MLLERNSISSGMLVRASDGSRLGRVYAIAGDAVLIRPRFRKDPRWAVELKAVKSLRRGDVILRGGSELCTPLDPATHPAPTLSVRGLSLDEQHALSAQ